MELSTALLDFGALGIFCAFLVYQHLNMQKRLDRLSEEWTTNLENVESSHTKAEEEIRDRYDKVLSRQEDARESTYKEIVTTINESKQLLEEVASKVEDIRRASLCLKEEPGDSLD